MSEHKGRKEPIDAMSEDLSSLVDNARGGDPSDKELRGLEARLLPLLGPVAGGAAEGGAAEGGAGPAGAGSEVGGAAAGGKAALTGATATGATAAGGTALIKVAVVATVVAGASVALLLTWPAPQTPESPVEPPVLQIPEESPPLEEPTLDELLEAGRRTEAGEAPPLEESRPRRPRRAVEAAGDDLAEAELLDRAQRVLGNDPSKALGLVREHAQRFPRGKMRLEREVLRVDALARAGRNEAAAEAARRFLAQNPGSAYQERMQALLRANH